MRYIVASPDKVRLLHFSGKFKLVRDTAAEHKARAAINFGFFVMAPAHPVGSRPVGQMMLKGVNYVWPSAECAHFHAVYQKDGKVQFWDWLPAGCEWGLRAGPRLVEDGKVCERSISDPAWDRGGIGIAAPKPRVAIGVRADGQVVLAYWDGATIRQAAQDMLHLECVEALAGDGGGSASWYDAERPEDTVSQRMVPNCFIIENGARPEPKPDKGLPKVDIDLDFERNITANFKFREFACKHCGAVSISPKFAELVARLQLLRDKVAKPVSVTSGYRCAVHDANVGTSGTPGRGPHTTGHAADIYVSSLSVDALASLAKACGFTGIGRYPKQGFVHVDLRQPPAEWIG